MKFKTDENLPTEAAELLRSAGLTRTDGPPKTTDAQRLAIPDARLGHSLD